MAIHPEMRAQFFGSIGAQFSKCLSPEMVCERPAIRAHSVQNAVALDLISREGHVICPTMRARSDAPPKINFKPVSRNKATTFTGLCGDHDREIFREIDTNPIDVANPRHLHLLAVRSILKELHATMDGASKLQSAYMKRVELELDPKGRPSPAGLEALSHMLKAWRTYRYRCKLDRIEKCPERLRSHVRVLATDMPKLAASIFFGLSEYTDEEDVVGAFINVIPLSQEQTAVAISYLDEHSEQCDSFFQKLFQSENEDFKSQLSGIIIRYAENFAINPDFFNRWTQEMKDHLEEVFVRTLFDGDAVDVDGISLL